MKRVETPISLPKQRNVLYSTGIPVHSLKILADAMGLAVDQVLQIIDKTTTKQFVLSQSQLFKQCWPRLVVTGLMVFVHYRRIKGDNNTIFETFRSVEEPILLYNTS
jgi:hypothetical protein